jgi:aspartate kinase
VVGMMRHQVGVVIIHEAGFWGQPGVPGEVCAALSAVGIDILAISTSVSNLSCVVAADRLADAVRVLKDTFDLS